VTRRDRELNDEINSHLDEATEDYVARGMSPEQARLAALRDFGGVTQTAQVYRESRRFAWLDDLAQDLRYTFRRLIKTPAFTLIVIATLALGIGANTAIFSLLDAVVLKPLPVPAVDELVTLHENGPEGPADIAGGTGAKNRFSFPRFQRLEQALGDRGSLAAVTRNARFNIRLPGETERRFVLAQLVSGRYFETLRVTPQRGRLITPDDTRLDRETPVAVVSHRFWNRYLNQSEDMIGKTVTLSGVPLTIIGITPPEFIGLWSDNEADLWVPVTLQLPLRYANNSSSYGTTYDDKTWLTQDLQAWLNVFGRLPAGTRSQAIAELAGANNAGIADLARTFESPHERDGMMAHTLIVEPFSRGFSGLRARFSDALFAITGMVVLVLIVMCANIANLLLARAAGNARDVGIRISLGASTGRLVRQCLTESITLALLGGTIGLAAGTWGSRFLARQVFNSSSALPQIFQPDRRLIVFAALVSLATAIAFGLAPAFRAVRAGRTSSLQNNQRQTVGNASLKGMRSLVVAQLALAVAVVFAAVLLGRTLLNFVRTDPGFSTAQLVTVSFDPIDSGYRSDQYRDLARRLVETVGNLPGVSSAAVSRCGLIAGCSSSGSVVLESGKQGSTFKNWISPDYFKTTGIPLLGGRAFTDRDVQNSPRVAIVNESAARGFFGSVNAVGKTIGTDAAHDTEIVGVVRDARTQTLHDAPVPMTYFPADQLALSRNTVFTNLDARVAADPAAMIPVIREALRRSEPNLLVGDVASQARRLERDLSRERLVAVLAFSFGFLTLLLASIGLYGVLSYGVARRTQEIGVRMALGARRAEVMRIVLGQSAKLTLVGIAVGLIATAMGVRYLSKMLYGVQPFDPLTFISVVVTFAIVTTLAAFVPARRATKVDPLVALRSE
jgi:predicted permease